jgi:hypothetical protein
MDEAWVSPFRVIPAGGIALIGVWLLLTGGSLGARGLRLASAAAPGANWLLMRGIRRLTQGLALVAIGLGWAFQWPVAIAAGLLFGFEELIETSIATAALRAEAVRDGVDVAGAGHG